MKLMVSARNTHLRVNRKLSSQGKKVRRIHSINKQRATLGDYVLVDLLADEIVETDVDLEKMARELGCLSPGEAFVSD